MSAKWKLADRIAHVTRILRQHRFENIVLQKYKPSISPYSGWFRIVASKNTYKIYVTELILDGNITKYSYTLLHKNKPLLRYDNSPHYPHISTYPHHKHVKETINPLQKPSIEEFMKETQEVIEKNQ
mgnify:FL=1